MIAMVEPLLVAVEAGGGLALFVVMVAENLFPPIPSEAVLPLAGFAAERGQISFGVAVAAATAGSVAGAVVLYAVGRFGGRPVLHRYHRLLRVDAARLDRAEVWFDQHGAAVVLWARMVPLARSAISVPAGMAGMGFGRFVGLTAIGSLVWNTLLIAAGWALGARWEQVSAVAGASGRLVLAALAVAGLVVLARGRIRRRRRAELHDGGGLVVGSKVRWVRWWA